MSHRQRGFTLLEILIAIVLLAVMMTLLLGTFRVAASTWDKGEKKAAQINRMVIVTNFLRSQIGGAMAIKEPPNPTLGDQPPVIFYGAAERLRYVGAIPAQVHGGIYQFELYLSDTQSGEGHKDLRAAICPLLKAKDNAPQPPCLQQDDKIDDVAIVEDIDSVAFHYVGQADPNIPGQGLGAPSDAWQSHEMPSIVAIDVTPQGEDPWPTIIVEPRADAVK
jgi:general secretion pathway protein J